MQDGELVTKEDLERKDCVVLDMKVAQVTRVLAAELVAQGYLTEEAFNNTKGATLHVNQTTGFVELILFGREDYKPDCAKIFDAPQG